MLQSLHSENNLRGFFFVLNVVSSSEAPHRLSSKVADVFQQLITMTVVTSISNNKCQLHRYTRMTARVTLSFEKRVQVYKENLIAGDKVHAILIVHYCYHLQRVFIALASLPHVIAARCVTRILVIVVVHKRSAWLIFSQSTLLFTWTFSRGECH